jgi:hypothetical protein
MIFKAPEESTSIWNVLKKLVAFATCLNFAPKLYNKGGVRKQVAGQIKGGTTKKNPWFNISHIGCSLMAADS